jgi:hypothetical protein
MRFLNQKIETFFLFLERKFRYSEKIETVNIDVLPKYVQNTLKCEPDPCPDIYAPKKRKHKEKAVKEIKPIKMTGHEIIFFKNLLYTNIDLYKDKLSEIATSPFVDYALRKKARTVCKQFKIDYIQWANDKIQSESLELNRFMLE